MTTRRREALWSLWEVGVVMPISRADTFLLIVLRGEVLWLRGSDLGGVGGA